MLTLLVKFNDQVMKTIEADKDVITIGRNLENDIHIDNLSVSKRHAHIVREADAFWVEDLKSTNGTYVNEKIVARQKLRHNDVITIGKHALEVLLEKTRSGKSPQNNPNDTMLLTTEKHKEMLKKQQKMKET